MIDESLTIKVTKGLMSFKLRYYGKNKASNHTNDKKQILV